MTKKEFEVWKQEMEEKITKLRLESEKLRLDTDRRMNATSKLLSMGAKKK